MEHTAHLPNSVFPGRWVFVHGLLEPATRGTGSMHFLAPAPRTQVGGLWPEKASAEGQVRGAESWPVGAGARGVLNAYGGTPPARATSVSACSASGGPARCGHCRWERVCWT